MLIKGLDLRQLLFLMKKNVCGSAVCSDVVTNLIL